MSYMANPNGAEGGGYQSGPPQMRPVMGYQPQQQMGGQASMQYGYPSMFGAQRGNVLGPPMQQPGMGMGQNPFAQLMQQHQMAQQAMGGMPQNMPLGRGPMMMGGPQAFGAPQMPQMPHPMLGGFQGQMPPMMGGMQGHGPMGMGPGVANFLQHFQQLSAPPQQNGNPMAGRLGAGHAVQQRSFFG